SLAGQPVRFQPTDLGENLLYSPERTFLSATDSGAVWAEEPSIRAEWVTRKQEGGFTFQLADGRWLTRDGSGLTTSAEPTAFELRRTSGCAAYPEAQVNVSGAPHSGVSDFQEVRGYVDAHVHGMAFEFL